jgi:hypothetical protein
MRVHRSGRAASREALLVRVDRIMFEVVVEAYVVHLFENLILVTGGDNGSIASPTAQHR